MAASFANSPKCLVPSRSRTRWLFAAMASVAMLAFAGMSAAQQQAEPEQTIKIGMSNSVMTVVYPFITNAQYFGLFKQEGVKPDVVMGQGSSQVISLLVAGTVELVYCNPEPVIQLNVEKASKLRGVYTTTWGQYVLAVPEGSPIQSVKDLKGKRLGMFGPQSGIDYLKARLFDVGLTPAHLEIVPTGFGGQTLVAIRQDRVDAILYWPDAMVMFRNIGLKLRDLPKAEWEKDLFMSTMVTTEDVIRRKPDAVARTLRAMAQGQMLSVVNPELTVETFWKQFPDQAPKPDNRDRAFQDGLARINAQNLLNGTPPGLPREQIISHQWGHVSAEAWERVQDNLFRVGTLSKKLDAASFIDTRFTAQANAFDRGKVIALGATAR